MPTPAEDPVLTSARREAIVVGLTWLCAMTYSVTYCYWFGYGRPASDLKFVLGFPDWIFYGLVIPWVICIMFSFYFGAFYMRDEKLGDDHEGSENEDFFVTEGEHA